MNESIEWKEEQRASLNHEWSRSLKSLIHTRSLELVFMDVKPRRTSRKKITGNQYECLSPYSVYDVAIVSFENN